MDFMQDLNELMEDLKGLDDGKLMDGATMMGSMMGPAGLGIEGAAMGFIMEKGLSALSPDQDDDIDFAPKPPK